MNSGIDSISPLVVSPRSPPARHGTRSLQRLFYYAQGEVRDVDGIQEFCMLHGARTRSFLCGATNRKSFLAIAHQLRLSAMQ